jgi:hypothetical protein
MRKSTLLAGIALVGLLAAPLAAQAQATSAGAESIRLGIKDWIGTSLNAANGTTSLMLSGPIEVAPSGDHYTLTIPASDLKIDPSEDGGGGTVAIGPITATLTPTPEGWYAATWTLPSEYVISENDGDDKVTVTIDSQAGKGVFAPEIQNFMSSDIALKGIHVVSTKDKDVTIAGIILKSDSTEQAAGIYDATMFAELDGLKVTEGGVAIGGMDKLTLNANAAGADLEGLSRFQDELEALQTKYDLSGEPPAGFFEEFSTLLAGLPVLFTGIDAKYTVEGVTIDQPGEQVQIASTSFGVSLDGLGDGASTFGFQVGLADLGIAPPPPFADLIPSDVVVDISLKGIPNADLMAALNGFVQSASTLGADAAGQMAAGQLAQALLMSDSTFEITEISAKTPSMTFDMTGSIKPNAGSPLMVAGTAKIVIGGLDQAIAAVSGTPDGQQMVQALTMVQTLGAQGTDAAGNPVRTYDVVISDKGDLLLNGTDLKPLLGGL